MKRLINLLDHRSAAHHTLSGHVQVSSAKEAATKIESELGNLNNTLKNIEDARSFDELTVCFDFSRVVGSSTDLLVCISA